MMKHSWLFGVFVVVVGCSAGPSEPQTGSEEEGVKQCLSIALCIQGYTWSQKACACLPDKVVKCGTKTCGAGDYCCNASCGICAPEGYACIQIACAPK